METLQGSSDDDDSDLDPCYLDNDGNTSYSSDKESGPNLRPIVGGTSSAASSASDDAWVTQGQLHPKFPFSGNPGIKVNSAYPDDPLAYFELFFDDPLIDMIVQQTNLYAKQFLDLNRSILKKCSRSKEWIDTNKEEMKVYLGNCPKTCYKFIF